MSMRRNTSAISEVANKLDSFNNDLQTNLKNFQTAVKNLESSWTGPASTATRNAVDEFAKDYFKNYYDMINDKVEFLREYVVKGTIETESTNETRGKSLSSSFK